MVAMLKMEQRRFWVGCILILVGVVLVFLGFYAKPIGEISGSVLGGTGEFLTLGGSLIGADAYVEYRIKKLLHDKNEQDH